MKKQIVLHFGIFLLICTSTAIAQKMTVKDNDANVLMEVNDEGTVGSITLPSGAVPASTTDKLYNVGGTLFWSGTDLTAGGSSVWTVSGSDIYYNVGNVGIGTTSPDVPLHIQKSINPYLALHATTITDDAEIDFLFGSAPYGSNREGAIQYNHETGSEGFRFWTRNSGGSEGIRMVITENGNVGIGTTSPKRRFHVQASSSEGIRIETTSFNSQAVLDLQNDARQWQIYTNGGDGDKLYFRDNTGGINAMVMNTSGNVGIGTTSPTHPLHMSSGAYVTTGGVWTDASSRDYKENIRELTSEEAIGALRELKPTKFNYKIDKEEEHVGFIAEDVPDLVANQDRNGLSPMDIVAVLTKVVQEQQKKIEELEARLNAGKY